MPIGRARNGVFGEPFEHKARYEEHDDELHKGSPGRR